jgi:hypothetical protein
MLCLILAIADEPDHILTCVGFWMEDMRSYLITFDEEDAISKFRCWVCACCTDFMITTVLVLLCFVPGVGWGGR